MKYYDNTDASQDVQDMSCPPTSVVVVVVVVSCLYN